MGMIGRKGRVVDCKQAKEEDLANFPELGYSAFERDEFSIKKMMTNTKTAIDVITDE